MKCFAKQYQATMVLKVLNIHVYGMYDLFSLLLVKFKCNKTSISFGGRCKSRSVHLSETIGTLYFVKTIMYAGQ
jgi:hypothetical protein